jgi:hypothetical protein
LNENLIEKDKISRKDFEKLKQEGSVLYKLLSVILKEKNDFYSSDFISYLVKKIKKLLEDD